MTKLLIVTTDMVAVSTTALGLSPLWPQHETYMASLQALQQHRAHTMEDREELIPKLLQFVNALGPVLPTFVKGFDDEFAGPGESFPKMLP